MSILQLKELEKEFVKATKLVDEKKKQVENALTVAKALAENAELAEKAKKSTACARRILSNRAVETFKKLKVELKTLENQLQNLKSEFQVFSNRVSKAKSLIGYDEKLNFLKAHFEKNVIGISKYLREITNLDSSLQRRMRYL